LSTGEILSAQSNEWKIYPNPVDDGIFVKGKNVEKIALAQILDLSGRIIVSETNPFKNKNSISVKNLSNGVFLLNLDGKVYQLIKK